MWRARFWVTMLSPPKPSSMDCISSILRFSASAAASSFISVPVWPTACRSSVGLWLEAPVPFCATSSSENTESPPKAPSPPPEIRLIGIVGLK